MEGAPKQFWKLYLIPLTVAQKMLKYLLLQDPIN